MTCYDSKEGSFPISYKDCQLLADACEEQIIQMEKNLEEISPEKYLRYKELHQYFLGIRKLMEARKIKEENAKKEEENFRKQLTESLQNQQ
ncbi:hypothetical protein DWZ61_05260 [Clostridium sp. AF34-10BH]|jgi:hypothetical protein|uniref:hypothetical protein n=1 Tax=Clostridium sp. AF34-10BH TaxID=2293011 RepID=UPI000FEEA785|nr:hypothetical protein [Clostridium sp. AF34-10BH]RHP33085.1 hypothetical protein DWZ61_05260 [Clostridium sp. AF34-10BH]